MVIAPKIIPGPVNRPIVRRSRLLFHWRADDLSLTPLTGQAPTFSRASAGGLVADAGGTLRGSAQHQPRWHARSGYTGLLLERASTNLIWRATDFNLWNLSGTPTVVAGQADPAGGASAYLVGDDDGAVNETISLDPVFTGDGTKTISIYAKPGTAARFTVALWDTTASAARGYMSVTWNADPTVAPALAFSGGGGVVFMPVSLGSGWWRLAASVNGVVAANTNRLYIFPAGDVAAATGTTYIYGAQAENEVFPSSLILTTGSMATRAADLFTSVMPSLTAWPALNNLSVYLEVVRPEWAETAETFVTDLAELFGISSGSPLLRAYGLSSSRGWSAQVNDGTTAQFSSVTMRNDTLQRVLVQCRNLRTAPQVALDVGDGLSAFGTAVTAIPSFANTTINIGSSVAAGRGLNGVLRCVKVAAGLCTSQQMQEMI